MAGLALFDLDNTLIDRLGAFTSWATTFVGAVGGTPDDLAWLLHTDDDGRTPLATLFDAARRRWDLAESVDDLVAAYRRTQADHYAPDPAVIEPLRRLRAAGWRIAVVTNGAPVQHRKVDRAGLTDLVDTVWVSSEVGSAKPDPAIFLEACRHRPGSDHNPGSGHSPGSLPDDV